MKVHIFPQARNIMQSGKARSDKWVLEYEKEEGAQFIDPVMGWTGSSDMKQELNLTFSSKEEAVAWARKSNLEYEVTSPTARKTFIQAYADNFK